MSPSRDPLAGLLRRLALDEEDPRLHVGWPGEGGGALFGGLVAAQAVVAAGRTVTDRFLHSLHAYFLRPGEHGVPIRFRVTALRDGRTFSTRAVSAEQSDETIFHCVADFTRDASGVAHQDACMPEAPEPGGLPEWEDLHPWVLGRAARRRHDGPIEVRVCDPDSSEPDVKLAARRRVWLRARGPLPDDPLIRAAVLAFASDRTLLRTGARPHGLTGLARVGASLDHALWIHRLVSIEDWVLYVTESPVAEAGRALMLGAMYSSDGSRIASVAQEGLIRGTR